MIPHLNSSILELTPTEFEEYVRATLDAAGFKLENYSSSHKEHHDGDDGEYEIDVTVRFTALGAEYLTLIECKHTKRPVEREKLQALHSKIHSIGAHKGMIFSTGGFQSGAIEFATAHKIATVHVTDGASSWMTRSVGPPTPPPPLANIPRVIGYLIKKTEGGFSTSLVSATHGGLAQELCEPVSVCDL